MTPATSPTTAPSIADPKVVDAITWQNNVLSKEQRTLEQNYSTDIASVRFMNNSLTFYYSLNFYLFVVYVLLGLIAMYLVFFKNATWSMPLKFMFLLLLALYPFVISYVEYALLYLLTYAYSLSVGTVHFDPYYKHPPVSMASIFSYSFS